ASLLLAAPPVTVLTYQRLVLAAAPPVAPANPAATAAAAPPAEDWRNRFDAVYRLKPGQPIVRVAPPFIAERARCLEEVDRQHLFDFKQGMSVFDFEGNQASFNRWTMERPTLENVLRFVAGVPRYKMRIDEFDRMRPLEGD